ncbi:TIGR03936 family radical SAM-associated protein [Anaeromicropila populeti]|uniref:Radical SAM-linked protein n=1 Tax=Anaeromicropila populeti TaxID=37658 RepID=A0A1I6L374_9FIRM|nr:TIGR03936 family radical SAM-associated protein [Anaeromicropila populeti]SFR97680.1 radical SAM-linked protein [Anaeromicropila populeti]
MKVRIKFSKTGSMKFIGHLDVMRYFQKAFRRCEINVSYSQGFNRHQVMSFAQPLGVGLTSEGEYLDAQLESSESSEEMIEKINHVITDEIQVLSFKLLPEDSKPAMSLVACADYRVELKDNYEAVEDFEIRFYDFYHQDTIEIEKKSKKSSTIMDIKPLIYEYKFEQEGLFLKVAAGSVNNLKPDLIMEAFYQFLGKELSPFSYQYHRIDLYAQKEDRFISLDDFGVNMKEGLSGEL